MSLVAEDKAPSDTLMKMVMSEFNVLDGSNKKLNLDAEFVANLHINMLFHQISYRKIEISKSS